MSDFPYIIEQKSAVLGHGDLLCVDEMVCLLMFFFVIILGVINEMFVDRRKHQRSQVFTSASLWFR